MRYEVRVIGSGEFEELLLATDNAAEATAFAVSLASGHYYGTAVIDRETGMADLGDRVVRASNAFDDDEQQHCPGCGQPLMACQC